MKTQPQQTTSHQEQSRHSSYRVVLVGLLAICTAAIVAGSFWWMTSSPVSRDPVSIESNTLAADVHDNEAPGGTAASSKLAGATESVDEHGIVRGTTPDGVHYTVTGRGEKSLIDGKVTLAAVGDQIGTDNSLPLAEAYGGGAGSGIYNFSPFYREVEPFVGQSDLRYINQETVMAGDEDGYAYTGYPTFNTPAAAADALAENGFNLVNFTTNHSYDLGTYGIERSHEVWARYPELLVGGSYLTQEDRETVHMIERNGLTFAFLAYTYGDNSFTNAASLPNSYYACPFDKEAIEADVHRAQQVADAVIVSMHWGTEYASEPNEQQWDYARFLADLDVDLVLGTHAHTMQPVKYVTGDSGNTIPVVFGLGDFISGWTLTDTILSGLFTCDFVSNGAGVEVRNPQYYPLIEWSDGGDVYVRMLKDMTDDELNANTRTTDVSDDAIYLRDKVNSMGTEVPIVM